jgi:hypothetical protein
MEVLRYTVEAPDGSETDYGEDFRAAADEALATRSRVICYEFEYSDSYLVADYTEEPAT